MSKEFEALQKQWVATKKNIDTNPNTKAVLAQIGVKKRESLSFHYGTVVILSTTLLVLCLFFYYVAPVQELLSRIGVGLMIGGLIVRIVLEGISISKSIKVAVNTDVLSVTNATIRFYKFRTFLHGTVAPIIVGLYTLGFYMLTPEFSLYFSFWKLVVIDVSYIIIAAILFVKIRKGIKKELKALEEIIAFRAEVLEE